MSEVDENYQGTDTEERLTIAGVNDGRDCLEDEEAVALYGRIVKVVIHEDVTEESYLLSAGQRDLEESARLLSTITLNAIDLHLLNVDVEKIKLGDSIRVVSAPHGLDAYMQVSAMKGVFTITEVKSGTGSTAGWGKLKSGAGWISLDYCKRL